MKNITKKQAADFYTAVRARMAKFPVHPQSWPDHSAWLVETHFGPLSVSVYPGQNVLFCVYLRFESDPKPIYEVLGDAMNRFSGKWNILTESAKMALIELDNRLARVKAVE